MSQRERVQAVLEDLCSQPHSPDRARHIRVLRAIFEEIRLMERRLEAIDPVMREDAFVRPLADVEREYILAAVRKCGSISAAATALDVAPATVYRHLANCTAEERASVNYRGGRSDPLKARAV